MRHRRKNSESSFELFLDTVCNTFGGILFIAILIAIQIRQTENRTEPQTQSASPVKIAELQQMMENLVAEIESAKILLETIRKTMPEPTTEEEKNLVNRYNELNEAKTKALEKKTELINDYLVHNQINAALEEKIKEANNLLQQYALEEETLENEIQKLQTTKQSLEQNIASTQKNIVQIQKDVTQIQKNMAQIQENIDDLSQKVAQKEKKLNDKNDNDKNSRSEKLRMPKLHFSKNNLTLNLMMRYNRLYDVSDRYDFDYFGDEVGKPKPNRGIIVDKTDASKKMVQELLRSYSSNNHYVTIFVYGDSADQFYLVRDCIVTAGFEYALIPITDDEVWTFGGSGDTRPVQ